MPTIGVEPRTGRLAVVYYVIRADGPRVQLSINGFQTVDYVETDPTVADNGLICVQIHSGPASEAWY